MSTAAASGSGYLVMKLAELAAAKQAEAEERDRENDLEAGS